MTKQRRFKQQVRGRMAKTGERYAAARGALIDKRDRAQDEPGDGGRAPSGAQPVEQGWTPPMSDDKVVAATGRTWQEWFALLDAAGAVDLAHPEIARRLVTEHGVDGWWAQSVTVAYEQARGRRRKHEGPDGFAISKSKTVAAPLARLYAAWSDDEVRARWLPEPIEITSQREGRTLNARWGDGPARIAVRFEARGEHKAQVSLGHTRIADEAEAERMKALWSDRLARLAELLTR